MMLEVRVRFRSTWKPPGLTCSGKSQIAGLRPFSSRMWHEWVCGLLDGRFVDREMVLCGGKMLKEFHRTFCRPLGIEAVNRTENIIVISGLQSICVGNRLSQMGKWF